MGGEIVIAVVSFILGLITTHVYARRESREQRDGFKRIESILLRMETAGQVEVERDAAGQITDAKVVTIETGHMALAGQPVVLTVSQGPPSAGNKPSIV